MVAVSPASFRPRSHPRAPADGRRRPRRIARGVMPIPGPLGVSKRKNAGAFAPDPPVRPARPPRLSWAPFPRCLHSSIHPLARPRAALTRRPPPAAGPRGRNMLAAAAAAVANSAKKPSTRPSAASPPSKAPRVLARSPRAPRASPRRPPPAPPRTTLARWTASPRPALDRVAAAETRRRHAHDVRSTRSVHRRRPPRANRRPGRRAHDSNARPAPVIRAPRAGRRAHPDPLPRRAEDVLRRARHPHHRRRFVRRPSASARHRRRPRENLGGRRLDPGGRRVAAPLHAPLLHRRATRLPIRLRKRRRHPRSVIGRHPSYGHQAV